MSADLSITKDGKAAIVSLKELPWHGQGVVLEDAVSGKEMLKLAHLDWDVVEAPVFSVVKKKVATGWNKDTDTPVYTTQEETVQINDKKSIVKNDTGDILGITGSDFRVFQNSEMVEFFEGLVQGKKITYEVAGSIQNFTAIWILARIPDLSVSIKGDEIVPYMLIKNGHIGNMTLTVQPTNIRVVCRNTMNAASTEFAERRKKYGKQNVHSGYKIRHTSGMGEAVKNVQNAYENIMNDFQKTKELYELLAGREVNAKEVREYFEKTLKVKSEEEQAKKASKAAETRRENKIADLMKLWEAPTNQTGTRNTAFSLYNTFVEYVDHEKSTRCMDGKDETVCRFESSMFGAGADMKDAALINALTLV